MSDEGFSAWTAAKGSFRQFVEAQLALAYPEGGPDHNVVAWVTHRTPRENALWIPGVVFMGPVDESSDHDGSVGDDEDEEMEDSD